MLNLKNILNEILSENVSPNEVNDAIDKKIQVIITYSDEQNRAPQKRLIEPYAYGRSKAGNSVFRAFQYEGDTFRGKPKWKLFRLDRVTSWNPTENHFNSEPKERKWTDKAYNENGDNSMATVLNMVKFDYDQNSNNPYDKGSDLYNIRKKTDNLKQSKPININQLNNEPIQNTPTNQLNTNNDDFQNMLKRNLDITDKEKAKRGFSLSKNQQNNINTSNDEVEQNKMNNDDFQNMLKRNLDITDKEKAKRGFSLKNKNNVFNK